MMTTICELRVGKSTISNPAAMTAMARVSAHVVLAGRRMARPMAARACPVTSTCGRRAPADAMISPPTTAMAMNRTDSGSLTTRKPAPSTAPDSVVSLMSAPATFSTMTTSPRKPAATTIIQPRRTSDSRRLGASQMPSAIRMSETRGATHAKVDTAWITGMI